MADDVKPAAPPFSLTTFLRERFRSFLLSLLGGGVGAVIGLILFFVLTSLYRQSGVPFGLTIWVAGGFFLGYLFHPPLLHLLHRRSRKEREARQGRPPADGAAPDGVRELVETVVFIFVLVLTLKAFDAEAFVIPTGSMAETLLGYQKWVVCPACGYRFPANCSQQIEPSDGATHWVGGCTCPNCRQHIRFIPRGQAGDGETTSLDEIADPEWGNGDHVLVSPVRLRPPGKAAGSARRGRLQVPRQWQPGGSQPSQPALPADRAVQGRRADELHQAARRPAPRNHRHP